MWLLGTRAHLFVFIRLEQHLQHCYSKMECVYLRYCIQKCLFAPVLCVCVLAPLFGRTYFFIVIFFPLIWDLLWNCFACTCVKCRRVLNILPTDIWSGMCPYPREGLVRWEPWGSVSPRLDVWSRHTQGVCPVPCSSVSSPRLGRRFPAFSTFVVASNLKSDLNYGGRVGFFLYRPNALLIKHCSQLVMSKGEVLHTSKPRKREK